jgi:nucleotide-binding universal stress UspA family protein
LIGKGVGISVYERILVPTDGSEGSAHVALQAIDLAEQYGATIHALYVVDEDVPALIGDVTGAERLSEQGQRAVERVERMARAHDVEAVSELREGDPAETILDCAEEIDADAIVAGTHGRSGLERRVIGSVAERLVRHAACPVMTVRLPETDVTVDDAEDARDIAAEALAEAGHDATVTGARRQVSVWVVDAEREQEDGPLVVYVDPVTRRTSVVSGRYDSD